MSHAPNTLKKRHTTQIVITGDDPAEVKLVSDRIDAYVQGSAIERGLRTRIEVEFFPIQEIAGAPACTPLNDTLTFRDV